MCFLAILYLQLIYLAMVNLYHNYKHKLLLLELLFLRIKIKLFYENGQIESDTDYINEIPTREKKYYNNGNIKSDIEYLDKTPIKEKEYYENGNIKLQKTNENNIFVEARYDEQGNILSEQTAKDGMSVELKTFYAKGVLEKHIRRHINNEKIDISFKYKNQTATIPFPVEAGIASTLSYREDGSLEEFCVTNIFTPIPNERCYSIDKLVKLLDEKANSLKGTI